MMDNIIIFTYNLCKYLHCCWKVLDDAKLYAGELCEDEGGVPFAVDHIFGCLLNETVKCLYNMFIRDNGRDTTMRRMPIGSRRIAVLDDFFFDFRSITHGVVVGGEIDGIHQ